MEISELKNHCPPSGDKFTRAAKLFRRIIELHDNALVTAVKNLNREECYEIIRSIHWHCSQSIQFMKQLEPKALQEIASVVTLYASSFITSYPYFMLNRFPQFRKPSPLYVASLDAGPCLFIRFRSPQKAG